ncbi:MAG: Hsp20/alpha crystallin family protein [Patescibacteria group bacterium]|nr:Hsp20/alpha crystallin family protein [Patescibacteria group bacterium]
MSFLDKLKVKVDQAEGQELEAKELQKEQKASGFLQLDVDILQSSEAIIIIAPIPGVEVKDLDISIENENDVVTIQGKRDMPSDALLGEEEKKHLRQECHWGAFYRQIILPQEVNVAEVKAKFKKGILILTLPLLRLQTSGKKKIVVNTEK